MTLLPVCICIMYIHNSGCLLSVLHSSSYIVSQSSFSQYSQANTPCFLFCCNMSIFITLIFLFCVSRLVYDNKQFNCRCTLSHWLIVTLLCLVMFISSTVCSLSYVTYFFLQILKSNEQCHVPKYSDIHLYITYIS